MVKKVKELTFVTVVHEGHTFVRLRDVVVFLQDGSDRNTITAVIHVLNSAISSLSKLFK